MTEITSKKETWNFMDKTSWSRGLWDTEPDKISWVDPATALQCLVVRNMVGALCGYVGCPKTHPAHGLSYDGSQQSEHDARMAYYRESLSKPKVKHTLHGKEFELPDLSEQPEAPVVPDIGEKIANISVHGGLTFSGPCQEPTKEIWEMTCKEIDYHQKQAFAYPKGDSAEWLKEWIPDIYDYETWAERQRARSICHVPSTGEPDDIHWFGFDCSHAFDLCPKMEAVKSSIGIAHKPAEITVGSVTVELPEEYRDTYKNIAYVTAEVESLAKQLKAMKVKQ